MGQTSSVTEAVAAPVVSVQGFHKRYRKQVAVESVDLAIQSGKIYGLIGPDGAGKSSLMKSIAGVMSFDKGKVEVFGVNVDSEAAAERVKGRLGFMPQGLGLNLYGELSVEENIDFFAKLRELTSDQLVERKRKLLAMTRLEKSRDRAMKHLSGGMKQKLGLVCTLIHEPKLVILDEPTTGVDPVSRRDFWAILAELLRESGITALVSTAYMDEAARFHNLSLLYEGRVLAAGEPNDILQQVPGSMVELSADPQIEALQRLKKRFAQVEVVGSHLRVLVEGLSPDNAVRKVSGQLSEMDVKDIRATEPELEDAFIALLRQRKLVEQEADNKFLTKQNNKPPAGDGLAIEAHGLTRDFGKFRAVDQASFQVKQGEIFGLLGANGAGKTTVIKMLTGILLPTGGEGQVAGADMRRAGHAIKERIGYMSQAFSLYQDLTVMENLRLYARIYGVPRRILNERIDYLIKMAGLSGVTSRLTGSLPMGIRQRLAINCALVHQPRVLFLDEPTSGVDPIGRRSFWEILVHLARVEQVAILVTTHYMSEAEYCDHLALMYAGRIIADATPREMKQTLEQEAGQLLEITTDRPLIAMKLMEHAGFDGVALFGKRIHLLARDIEKAEKQIRSSLSRQNIHLISMTPRVPTLEDVFVYRIMTLEKKERT